MSALLTGWAEFAVALAAFFASHTLPVRPPWRRRLTDIVGERGFSLGYSALSLVVLAWLVVAAGRAPYVELWPPSSWQGWAPNLVMPLVCFLLTFAIGAPSPLSFGGARNERFDPAHPGIAGIARHPLLLALALWAASHAVPNGDAAHVLLFGLFAAFAVLGMGIIDRRKRRLLGEARWRSLAAATSLWPFAALLDGRWRPDLRRFSPLRLAIASVLYAVLLALHAPVIGVAPWMG